MLPLLHRTKRALALGLAALATAACGSSNTASVLAKPPEYQPQGQAKSDAAKSQTEPLIVEWPAAARAKLEALTKKGLVVVRYTGFEMEVLSGCRAPEDSAYSYTPITRHHDSVVIRNEDDLYANLPLGAVELAGKLKSSGQLNVTMTIVGTYQAERQAVRRDELEGDCDRATHVVTALSAGAFELFAGAGAELGAEATAYGAGTGGRSSSKREVLNQAGDEGACVAATAGDTSPPYGCGALIRVEVDEIRPAKASISRVEPRPGSTAPPALPDSGAPVEPGPNDKPPEKPVKPSEAKPTLPKPDESSPAPPGSGHAPDSTEPRAKTPCPFGTVDAGDHCVSEAAPSSGGPLSPAPEPPPARDVDGDTVRGVVILGLLVVGVVGGVAAIIVKATKEPAPPLPSGLGTAPVNHRYAPVIRW